MDLKTDLNWKGILKSFLATLLMGTGVSLFVACQLGSDPLTVFLDGFQKTFGVSISIVDQVINLLLFGLAFLMNRRLIGLNTVVNVLALGICIEIPTLLISTLNIASQAMPFRLLMLLAAQVCLTGSIAWMQTFPNGICAFDIVLFTMMKRTNIKYVTIRVIYDSIFIATGYLLGGIVGFGTVFTLLTNGFFTVMIRKLIDYMRTKGKKCYG